MLLRNYDNIMTGRSLGLCNTYLDSAYLGDLYSSDTFGDGHLNVKNMKGDVIPLGSNNRGFALSGLYSYNNTADFTSSQSNYVLLICGYIGDEDVTYDDYSISTIPALSFVSHRDAGCVYDQATNECCATYEKVLSNTSTETILINCIGIKTTVQNNTSQILVYKEKLPSTIEVPAGANVVLTFKTKVSMNQNKPADYVASASVK